MKKKTSVKAVMKIDHHSNPKYFLGLQLSDVIIGNVFLTLFIK